MAKHKKTEPHAKKTVQKKTAKPAQKKLVSAPAKKPAPKPAPTKKIAVPPTPKPAVPSTDKKSNEKKESARDLLRSRILGNKKAAKPIAFSLEEVREIAKSVVKAVPETEAAKAVPAVAKATSKIIDVTKTAKPTQPNHIKAASLADILGCKPKRATKPPMEVEIDTVPDKFRR